MDQPAPRAGTRTKYRTTDPSIRGNNYIAIIADARMDGGRIKLSPAMKSTSQKKMISFRT